MKLTSCIGIYPPYFTIKPALSLMVVSRAIHEYDFDPNLTISSLWWSSPRVPSLQRSCRPRVDTAMESGNWTVDMYVPCVLSPQFNWTVDMYVPSDFPLSLIELEICTSLASCLFCATVTCIHLYTRPLQLPFTHRFYKMGILSATMFIDDIEASPLLYSFLGST